MLMGIETREISIMGILSNRVIRNHSVHGKSIRALFVRLSLILEGSKPGIIELNPREWRWGRLVNLTSQESRPLNWIKIK